MYCRDRVRFYNRSSLQKYHIMKITFLSALGQNLPGYLPDAALANI